MLTTYFLLSSHLQAALFAVAGVFLHWRIYGDEALILTDRGTVTPIPSAGGEMDDRTLDTAVAATILEREIELCQHELEAVMDVEMEAVVG